MKPVHTFRVTPSLPPPLEGLRELAYNVRWAWDHDTIELFRRLDSQLWETSGHNPVAMLGSIGQDRLREAAADESFLAHLERVSRDFDAGSKRGCWFTRSLPSAKGLLVAYFSAEFGLTECLSIFAGGLGVLAGDHLKAASDLGLPLVGVGLLYQQGYFQQHLNQAGWQQEAYKDNDFYNLPLTPVSRGDGAPLLVEVEYPGRRVAAQVWRIQVGRVPLYLLDTNLPQNRPEDRDVTDQLYGGDLEMRIRQEILLGIGGYRALEALGIQPTVYHMNEGHSAFLALERVRRLMEEQKLAFAEARQLATASLVFTGHTPVEAGHDYFPPELMNRYFDGFARSLGLSQAEFLGLGRRDPANAGEAFCMTVLALRMAASSNGVSRLHGQVSRRMWQSLWPGVPVDEVPIGHVTNGVHFRSWISNEMNQLYDRYLGPHWREEPTDRKLWQQVEKIPAEELWRTHERRRERLVAFARRRLKEQMQRRGAPQADMEAAGEVLDPEALTIGFARRFATYKRATLLLRDPDRLARILNDPQRPVQIIYAGKAHPRDDGGKDLIRQIVALAGSKEFRRRLVFLEDYDMAISRYLVQGCDVWLNTPRPPLEASGTSGMKAATNGALNVSTLDGWWYEAWKASESGGDMIGWAIGSEGAYDSTETQDRVEAQALYDILEHDVVPAFFERGADRLPRRWIAHMRASLGKLCHFYNTHRMVCEYTERFYLIADARFRELAADSAARARALGAWLARVQQNWRQVRVELVEGVPAAPLRLGEAVHVRARVHLDPLRPEDVTAELYLGRVDARGEIIEPTASAMQCTGREASGAWIFEASPPPSVHSGLHGYTVRVLPYHPDLSVALVPGLITWA